MNIFFANGTYFVTQFGFREPVQFPPSRVNILQLPTNDLIQIRTKPRPSSEPPEPKTVPLDDLDDSDDSDESVSVEPLKYKNNVTNGFPRKLPPKQAPKLKPPAPKLGSVIIKKTKHNDASVAAKPSGSSSVQNKKRIASYEPRSIKSKLSKMFTKQPNSTPPVLLLENEAFVMQGFKLNKPFVIPRKPKAPSVEREPSAASEDLKDSSTTPQLDTRANFRTPSPPVFSFEGETNSPTSPIRLYVDNESDPINMDALLASPHDVRNGGSATSLVDDNSPQSSKSSSPPPEIPHVQKSGAAVEMPTDDLDVLNLFADDEEDFAF